MVHREITAFYDRYKQRLYNIALRITGDSFDAEEIVQDTVLKYLRSGTGNLNPQQVEAWLAKACARASIDMLRIRKALKLKLERLAEEDSEEDCSQEWDALFAQNTPDRIVGSVRQALKKMPDGYRVVLSLLLFEGYDIQEASQILQVEESTVRSQYLRGKRRLLNMLRTEDIQYNG